MTTDPIEIPAWVAPVSIPARFETERLIARPYTLADVDELFERINASRDHLTPWLGWAIDGYRTVAQAAEFVARQMIVLENPGSFSGVALGVFLKSTGELVGGSGVHELHRATASCETGYWVERGHTGKGYAGEVCAGAISWAMRPAGEQGLGLRRVRVICSSANTRSVRVIEKLGLPKELCQREEYHLPGIGLTDRLGWGVMAHEWDTERHRMRS